MNLVGLLLNDPRVPTDIGHYWLGVASFAGHVQVVDLLLRDSRISLSGQESTVLRCAVKGDTEIARMLMKLMSM